jgi:hypothetical protein
MVVYRSKMTHSKNKKNFSISNSEEFIAAITQHISDKNLQLVRYFGWYSNRMRGERRKMELEEEEEDVENGVLNVANYNIRLGGVIWQRPSVTSCSQAARNTRSLRSNRIIFWS